MPLRSYEHRRSGRWNVSSVALGVGDLVKFNQGFPLLGIEQGDRATVIGVAAWGEWMVLCGETAHLVVRQFPAAVLEVIESASLRVSDPWEGP